MRLDGKDIRARLRDDFHGDLLFMVIHFDDSAAHNPRPMAQLTRHPEILPHTYSTGPRSLARRGSLHVKGIIHHEPKQRMEH